MKYIILLGDGMADEPLDELGGQTPLEYAETPNMDRVAREGACGMMRTIPRGFEAGSDIANLSILGYDPQRYYTGRGPLEAASMGIDLGPEDVAYRCNLVTVENGTLLNFSSDHISSQEGASLINSLKGAIQGAELYPGVSYRNLLVIRNGKGSTTTPPHDIVGEPIVSFLPKGGDGYLLRECMSVSHALLPTHPINVARRDAGKAAATMLWPWGGGSKPILPSFHEKYGIQGGMISAVDLLNGIARYAGMAVIKVPGATGYLDTDYQAKATYALQALEELDFMYVHVEAPDEAAHMGSIEEKICAIEAFDGIVGTVLDHFGGVIAVLPDHPTPIKVKTHTRDPVPFAVRGKWRGSCSCYSEREALHGSLGMIEALNFLPLLFS